MPAFHSRFAGVLGVVAGLAGLTGCPSAAAPTGGVGGAAGQGGSAGEAGQGGFAGEGGASGAGGEAGQGGAAGGAGQGGAAGEAGQGGAAGEAGQGGSAGGTGGAAGAAGGGGSGGASCDVSPVSPELPAETEQNDLKATADALPAGALGFTASLCPVADIDVFSFEVVGGGSSLVVAVGDGAGGCPPGGADVLVTVEDAQGTDLAQTQGNCPTLTAQDEPGLADLAPGSYFVKVESALIGVVNEYVATIELVPPGCGDGVVQTSAGEQCDDGNTLAGDGCDAVCIIETVCGDGIIGAAEQCDDGDLQAGDGCSPACEFEGAVCSEAEPNGTIATANPATGCALVAGALAQAGDQDYFQVNVTVPGSVLRAEVVDVGGTGCPASFDSYLRVYDANGTELGVDDDGGVDLCSLIDPALEPWAQNLGVGSYFVSVRELGDNEPQPFYMLKLTVSAPGCGDSLLQVGEQCDDGNVADGDGCSSTCTFEGQFCSESEVNSGLFVADVATGCDAIQGSIGPVGDKDFFAIDVPVAGASLRAAITNGSGACPAGFDSFVKVYDSIGAEIGSDDNDGPDSCSLVNPVTDAFATNLPAGTYYVSVEENGNNATASGYVLELDVLAPGCGDGVPQAGEECDDGNLVGNDGCSTSCQLEGLSAEVEPNGTLAQATPLGAGDSGFLAAITPSGDLDYFAITVPAGGDLRVETTSPFDANACPGDTEIFLLNAAGVELGSDDDDSPNGSCSLIDPATDAFAANLPAGTYYVRVEEFGNNGTLAGYQLRVQLLP